MASTLFLDANILYDGIVSRWGLSKAVLSLCSSHIHRLVLAEYVANEVIDALLRDTESLSKRRSDEILDDYEKFLELSRPRLWPLSPHAWR